ncbi:hypothetical protein J2Z47_002401 [Cohnella thailandensis]|nr:hypothetical protein [Cohnella thailandensis]
MSIPLDTLTLPHYNNQQLNIRIMPMKRFQLGGVLVKSSPGGLIPKLTGPARYRGTKRIGRARARPIKLGGTASRRSSSQLGTKGVFLFSYKPKER